ncbi:MAG: hypothetical protein Q9167_005964 [Letrouitia subvulpina]
MSGRGRPGGGLVRTHNPDDVQVTLNLRISSSSQSIPLQSLEGETDSTRQTAYPRFYIRIHASVKSSSHSNLPVTLATWRTPLERPIDEDEIISSSPVWINSALTPFHSTSDPSRCAGPPELGYIVHRRGGYPRNLRESWDFVTVPSADSGQEVVISHLVPLERLRFWSTNPSATTEPVRPEKGERFRIRPSEGGLGTFWWRWGDLDGDLAGKKFCNNEWFEGNIHEGQDGDDYLESEGENGFGLVMEVENETEVEFV